MNTKHALYASEAHPLLDSIQNLLACGFAVSDRNSIRVKPTPTRLAQVGLGAVFGLPILDGLFTLTSWALRHLPNRSRCWSHYLEMNGLTLLIFRDLIY